MRNESGRQLRMFSLGLVLLLLLSVPLWPQSYDGPRLPEGWYPVHETELGQLEALLTRQETLLSEQESELMRARQALTEANRSLVNSETQMQKLARSLDELGVVLKRRETLLWIAAAVITAEAAALVVAILL